MPAQQHNQKTSSDAVDERHAREYSTQSPPDQPPPAPDARTERIAKVSPEGIPADPSTNRRSLQRLIVTIVVVVLIAALLVAVFLNRWAGLGLGALAGGLLLFNPVMWAAILRVKEREQG